jgi:2-methylcitrate dehydratase PrpD
MMTPLEMLAGWASTLRDADIPAEQHLLARLRVLDTFGLISAAGEEPVCGSVLQFANRYAKGGAATVIVDGAVVPPAIAALVHGSLAHARDFDDTFPDSVIHPGSVVIPAALSVAEQADAAFSELSTAIVLGYEIAARVGKVAGRGFHARGFHATGIVGPIAAAGSAGYLLRLDANAMADAIGLAASMSSGLFAFLADGAWSKWMHAGWAAHGGIIAAELAKAQFRGPHHAFDHSAGLYRAFLGSDSGWDLASLCDGVGTRWLGAGAQPKSYPCAHVIHPFIDVALALRSEGRAHSDQIAAIRCALAPWALPIVCEPRAAKLAPRNDLEAIASLPFMLAAALCDGRVDLATLRPATLQRKDLQQFAARIACESDATLGTGFDGLLTIERSRGEVIKRRVALAPADAEAIRRKFRSNAAILYDTASAQALESAIMDSEAPRVREIIRLARRTRSSAAPA